MSSRKYHTQESKEVSPFPAGGHKAAKSRKDSIIIKTTVKQNDVKDPQRKHHLGTISKKIMECSNCLTVPNSPFIRMCIKIRVHRCLVHTKDPYRYTI